MPVKRVRRADKRSRGRPMFEPTDEQRLQVEMLAGEYSQAAIARVIGIDVETLKKHFAEELANGPVIVAARCYLRLERLAAAGSGIANRFILDRKERIGSIGSAVKLEKAVKEAEAEAKPPKLGKKEQAREDARNAEEGTSWAGLVGSDASLFSATAPPPKSKMN